MDKSAMATIMRHGILIVEKLGGDNGGAPLGEGRTMILARFAACAAMFLFLIPPPADAAVREKTSLRFLRGVYVLRQLNPGDHWLAVTVPRQVRTHDTTSALLAHRDKAFVLESVSRDLASAAKTGAYPEAHYYAARAFSLQGKYAEAAKAMKAYIAKAPFRDKDYLFLVTCLHASADYKNSLAAVRQWQLRDDNADACSEERLTYAWGSLQARGLYREAMEEVLSDPCASWRGQLFFAKSTSSLGDEAGAQERVEELAKAFPDKRHDIQVLWNRLSSAALYP